MILAGTGHRPKYLGLSYSESDNNKLTNFCTQFLKEYQETAEFKNDTKISHIISGGATGFDQSLAEASIILNIPLTLAIPFPSFDSQWPANGKQRFNKIKQKAEKVFYVFDGPYNKEQFKIRDEWMVDNADMIIALYDKNNWKSGTGMTVRYAEKQKKNILNVWEFWKRFKQR